MIYFDANKQAYGFEIENYIATVDDAIWQQYSGTDKWDIIDGQFVDITDTEEYKERKKQKEKERIAKLSLTKREVFLALYKDKGITPEQLKAQILDPEALIEFEYATDYYRGNPLIDQIGIMLGYTSKDLDYLFEHKELPSEEEDDPSEDEQEEGLN